jgi:hypothetical protein
LSNQHLLTVLFKPEIHASGAADLFAPASGWESKLPSLFWGARLRTTYAMKDDQEVEAAIRDVAADVGRWVLTPQGLRIGFSAYEAGSYAGTPRPFTVSSAVLQPIGVGAKPTFNRKRGTKNSCRGMALVMKPHRELYRGQHRTVKALAMPNIASALKSEIARVIRKEVKGEIQSLKKLSAQHRSHIAALKRQVNALEKLLRQASKGIRAQPAAAAAEDSDAGGVRFRAKGFATHRARLGLSAAQAGAMLGVSGQTIYHW